jgi:hypothetical protein
MAKEKSFDAIFQDLRITVQDIAKTNWTVDGRESLAELICNYLTQNREKIEEEYSYINRRIKRKYMSTCDGLLDRHKCAAAFMMAFLEIIEMPHKQGLFYTTLKERFAIFIGLSIMATMMKEELLDMEKKKADGVLVDVDKYNDCWNTIAYWKKNKEEFVFPNVICDANPYHTNWALELHYAQKENRLFALSLANELFCIEMHNRLLAKIELR